ncbi:MAG: BrnT family toxin [Rhodoferax sp.]
MDITFDAAKNLRNIADRGLSFERVGEFDFETAVYSVDARRDYGEPACERWGCWLAVCMRWCLWRPQAASGSSAFARRINVK